MGVFQNNLMGAAAAAASAGGGDFYSHQIANSVRMSKSGNSTLKFTAGTPTSADTFTYSWWWKRYNITDTSTNSTLVFCAGTGGGTYVFFTFTESSTMHANFNFTGGGYGDSRLTTDMLFRDTSAWYHCVLRCDSTQSTASNRVRLYVNGVEPSYSSASVQTAVSQNEDFGFMNESGVVQSWGGISGVGTGSEGCDVQLAEIVMCDGQSYGPDSFGETKNGVWIPKDPSGLTFGNNGYYLKFESSSDLGNDSSGNNNDFTASGLSAHDQMTDTPTFNSDSNGGNFCTYNPIVAEGGAQKLMTLSEGNLHAQSETNDKYHQIIGTHGVKTGKWYIEWYIEAAGYPSWAVGWRHGSQLELYDGSTQSGNANLAYVGYFTGSNVYIKAFGSTATADPQVAYSGWTSAGDAPTTGDVMMCAIDMDAGKVWWGFNGEWGDVGSGTGNPATGANASNTWTVANYTDHIFPFTLSWANPDAEIIMNCGQDGTFAGHITAGGNADDTGYGNFKYDVPAGFLSLCTGNLPTADEIDPAQTDDDYPQKLFGATIWTGDGTTSRAITGLGFQPDWVWFKARSSAFSNRLYDTTRGISSTGGKRLFSNTTGAETDQTSGQDISAVGTDGFTLGASSNLYTNDTNSGGLHVAWTWRANGGTTSSNATGDITSTVQADPSGGFSIFTYTGSGTSGNTVAHGLSQAPTMTIIKQRNSTNGWNVWATGYNSGDYDSFGELNTDGAWNADQGSNGPFTAAPGATLLTLTAYGQVNGSSNTYVGYAFSDIEGYIKSGSYVGNANADGTFVYTGFKPAFFMCKPIVAGNWRIQDTKRSPFNVANKTLYPNHSNAEESYSSDSIDILSNGVKMRASDSNYNQATTFVYLAMAHNPFKYATAR